jgi:hypothetical protein
MKTTVFVAAAALILSAGAAFAGEGGDQAVIYPVNRPGIDGPVAVAPYAMNQSQMAWIEGNSRYAASHAPSYAAVPQPQLNATATPRQVGSSNG